MVKAKVVVKWKAGLHQRPSSDLVKMANKYKSLIQITNGKDVADAKSILSLFLLVATCGTELTISIDGEDEIIALDELKFFFDKGDGEETLKK